MKTIRYGIFAVLLMATFSSCLKEYSFENLNGIAHGSLQSDLSGDCLPKTVSGSFLVGQTLSDSNSMQIDVNVSSIGAYKISTDTVNGYSFEGTGVFSSTGVNTIKLAGKGTPRSSGTNLFVVSFDSSLCLIEISALPAGAGGTTPPLTSTYFWKFTEAGFVYQGDVAASDAQLITNATPVGTLSIFGFAGSTITGDTLVNIALTDLGGGINGNEIYNTSSSINNPAVFEVSDFNGTLYEASASTPGVNIAIKITSHNTTTKVIDGTFSGTAKNGSGATKTITAGQFKAQYQ